MAMPLIKKPNPSEEPEDQSSSARVLRRSVPFRGLGEEAVEADQGPGRRLAGAPVPPKTRPVVDVPPPALEPSRQPRLYIHWQSASIDLLREFVRIADPGDLAGCLEGASVQLIARFLAIEPQLANAVPTHPAPVDELVLLWRGLAAD